MKRFLFFLFFIMFFCPTILYAGDTIHIKKYQSSIGYGYTFPLLKMVLLLGPGPILTGGMAGLNFIILLAT
jgi:hypothetical protein